MQEPRQVRSRSSRSALTSERIEATVFSTHLGRLRSTRQVSALTRQQNGWTAARSRRCGTHMRCARPTARMRSTRRASSTADGDCATRAGSTSFARTVQRMSWVRASQQGLSAHERRQATRYAAPRPPLRSSRSGTAVAQARAACRSTPKRIRCLQQTVCSTPVRRR